MLTGASLTRQHSVKFTVRSGCHWGSNISTDRFKEAGNRYVKSEKVGILKAGRTFDLPGELDEKVHGEQRKLVARAYSMESMIHLEPRVDETLNTLLQKLDQLQGQTVDLAQWLQIFAFGTSHKFPRHKLMINTIDRYHRSYKLLPTLWIHRDRRRRRHIRSSESYIQIHRVAGSGSLVL